jgi:hypothetical protein
MNDRMDNTEMVELEHSLRALAAEDCHVQAPPQVEASVMQTWYALRAFDRQRCDHGSPRAALLAIGSMAAAIVVAVVMNRAPSEPSRLEPVVARVAEKPPVITSVPPAERERSVKAHRRRPLRPRRQNETMAPPNAPGMMLVADQILDASATSIVRVRVPRTALLTLGIPLVEPDDGGSVEVELHVGEDGVARTIRRAVPVAVRQK